MTVEAIDSEGMMYACRGCCCGSVIIDDAREHDCDINACEEITAVLDKPEVSSRAKLCKDECVGFIEGSISEVSTAALLCC